MMPDVLRLRRMSATLAGMPDKIDVGGWTGVDAERIGVEAWIDVLAIGGGVGTAAI